MVLIEKFIKFPTVVSVHLEQTSLNVPPIKKVDSFITDLLDFNLTVAIKCLDIIKKNRLIFGDDIHLIVKYLALSATVYFTYCVE